MTHILTWQAKGIKMDDWAKVVTEEGETIYINPTTGKFVHEVGASSITSWGGIQIDGKGVR